jgi:hypothetical protein
MDQIIPIPRKNLMRLLAGIWLSWVRRILLDDERRTDDEADAFAKREVLFVLFGKRCGSGYGWCL